MYDRHQVYQAFRTIAPKCAEAGKPIYGYGNACDKTNRGQYKSQYYQRVTELYYSGDIEAAIKAAIQ